MELNSNELSKFTKLVYKNREKYFTLPVNYVKKTTGRPTGTGSENELCLNMVDKNIYLYNSGWVELYNHPYHVRTGNAYVHYLPGSDDTGDSGEYDPTNDVYVCGDGEQGGGEQEVAQITVVATGTGDIFEVTVNGVTVASTTATSIDATSVAGELKSELGGASLPITVKRDANVLRITSTDEADLDVAATVGTDNSGTAQITSTTINEGFSDIINYYLF